MGLKQKFGDNGFESLVLNQVQSTGVTPVSYIFDGALDFDNFGFQMITEAVPARTVIVTGTDHVVASTHTWTFANAAFTSADVGGTITVAGATNAANNNTFTISTVTNATTIVTTGSQTNETFSGVVTLSVTSAAGAGAWKLYASNNHYGASTGNNTRAVTGSFVDVTSLFNATPTAVTTASDQYRQVNQFAGRNLKIEFTPTSGAALVSVYLTAKDVN